MVVLSNIIWIDSNINSNIISKYITEIETLKYYKIKKFDNIKESITEIKKIEFEETIIIISGELYINFIEQFKKNIKDIYIIPKIIIFTGNEQEFIENNKSNLNINHPFYNSGGIKTKFDEIKEFILNPVGKKTITLNREDDGNLVFDFIDCKEKLLLPMLYKTLIEVTSNDEIEKFGQLLYNRYWQNDKELEKLLNSIKSLSNIPIELLSKYYARIELVNFLVT